MLFSTYTPPPPPKKNNGLAWGLGICGGCVGIVVIGIAVVTVTLGKDIKKGFDVAGGVVAGTQKMVKNMPVFLEDLKSHDYAGASALVDPEYKSSLSEKKLQDIEEKMESKLGALKNISKQPSSRQQNTDVSGEKGKVPGMTQIYSYNLTYEKGPATATFYFKTKDMSKFSGLVTDFKIAEGMSAESSGSNSGEK